MAGLTSPEGVIMVCLAVMLDILGIICLILWLAAGVGGILSYIPDIIGIFFFGFWMLMKSQEDKTYKESRTEVASEVAEHHKKVKTTKKVFKKGAKRASKSGIKFFAAMLGELVPLIGALPFWTMFVVSELKEK